MGLNDTPRGSRLHIGIFGKRNAGKSSLINALTGQNTALVSDTPGTTTDPVYKAMELHPIGPVVFIDTAGFDDEGTLGKLRVKCTEDVVEKSDVAVMVVDGSVVETGGLAGLTDEKRWADMLLKRNVPLIVVLNKYDTWDDSEKTHLAETNKGERHEMCRDGCGKDKAETTEPNHDDCEKNNAVEERLSEVKEFLSDGQAAKNKLITVVRTSALKKKGIEELREAIRQAVPEDFLREKILGDMVEDGGLVLLVMPQDIQAPKGRLILPQVQTLRELLDKKCTAAATTADGFERTLAALSREPDLIITDSQCFKDVYEAKPRSSRLTSFSVLFAAYKGDINVFSKGALQLDDMTEKSKVLIAEACTHVPLSEDIGRVKIPNLLRKRFGESIEIVNVCGNDFPAVEDLKDYDLVIHCGACMFNRKHVLNRIAAAEAAGVPITNYGVVLAKLTGILDKIELPAGAGVSRILGGNIEDEA